MFKNDMPSYQRSTYRYKRIRDPIHEDIYLSKDEIAIINTPEFQRLRGIKQLGLAELVYPGAVHSRFSHSLGVLYMAEAILNAMLAIPEVEERIKTLEEEHFGERSITTIRKIVRFAALLHDLGHIPFGHTFEDEMHVLYGDQEHEKRTLEMIESSDVIKQALGSLKDHVKQVIQGTHPLSFLNDIVGNTISADLLDYLVRDLFYTGLQGRGFDRRILEYFCVDEEGHLYIDLFRGGRARIDVRSELVNILRTRYELAEKVYYHHAKVAADAMLTKAFAKVWHERRISEQKLRELTDFELLNFLATESKDQVVQNLVLMLRSRRLYKPTYMPRAQKSEHFKTYHDSYEEREALENDLAKEAGLDKGDVVIFCPDPDMQLKEAAIRVLWEKRVEQGNMQTRIEPFNQIATGKGDSIAIHKDELALIIAMHKALWNFIVFVHPAKYNLFNCALSISDSCINRGFGDNDLWYLDPVREKGEWGTYKRVRQLCQQIGGQKRLNQEEVRLLEKNLVEGTVRRGMSLKDLYRLQDKDLMDEIERLAESLRQRIQGIPLQ